MGVRGARSEGRCAQVGARHLRVPAHLRHRAKPVLHLRNQDSDGRPAACWPSEDAASGSRARLTGSIGKSEGRPSSAGLFGSVCSIPAGRHRSLCCSPSTVWWRRKRGGKEPSGPSAWARGAAAGPGQGPAAHDAPRGGSPPGPARRASPGAHSSLTLPASHTDARGCPVPARSPSAVSVTRGPKPVSGKLQKQTIHRFSVTCF